MQFDRGELVALGAVALLAGAGLAKVGSGNAHDVIDAWLAGKPKSSGALSTDGLVLKSYATEIGATVRVTRRTPSGPQMQISKVVIEEPGRSSRTTVKHMNYARQATAGRAPTWESTESSMLLGMSSERLTPADFQDRASREEERWAHAGPWEVEHEWDMGAQAYLWRIRNIETDKIKKLGPAGSRVNWYARGLIEAAKRNRAAAGQ